MFTINSSNPIKIESSTRNHKIIYKQNPIIRGYFLDANNKNTILSEFAFDVLNSIYLTIQQNLFAIHPKEFQNKVKIEIDLRALQVLLHRKRRDQNDIKNAIEELYQTDIVLKDFTHPITGSKYREFHARIIEAYGYRKEDKNICDIQINEMFLVNVMRHPKQDCRIGNFTPIRLYSVSALRGKHTKRLYEYIESMIDTRKEFSLSLDSLNKLFGAKYNSLSDLVKIITRTQEQLEEIYNFNFEVFKKDKLISFKISRKNSNKKYI